MLILNHITMKAVVFGVLIISGSIFLNCKNRVVETKSTTSQDSGTMKSKAHMDSLKMKMPADSARLVTPKAKDSLKMNK